VVAPHSATPLPYIDRIMVATIVKDSSGLCIRIYIVIRAVRFILFIKLHNAAVSSDTVRSERVLRVALG